MGLLDDAIREHLELKRRHGAEAGEIDELEREALGPVRRDRAVEPEPEAADAAPDVDDEPLDDDQVVAPEVEPAPRRATGAYAATAEPEPVAFTDAPDPVPDEAPLPPPRDVPDPDEEDPWLADDATQEHAAARPSTDEEAPPATDADDGEDVLEETPDFLQETPEHDRLWFEQKPPKNFDWDR